MNAKVKIFAIRGNGNLIFKPEERFLSIRVYNPLTADCYISDRDIVGQNLPVVNALLLGGGDNQQIEVIRAQFAGDKPVFINQQLFFSFQTGINPRATGCYVVAEYID